MSTVLCDSVAGTGYVAKSTVCAENFTGLGYSDTSAGFDNTIVTNVRGVGE